VYRKRPRFTLGADVPVEGRAHGSQRGSRFVGAPEPMGITICGRAGTEAGTVRAGAGGAPSSPELRRRVVGKPGRGPAGVPGVAADGGGAAWVVADLGERSRRIAAVEEGPLAPSGTWRGRSAGGGGGHTGARRAARRRRASGRPLRSSVEMGWALGMGFGLHLLLAVLW
jgi:hypothetical protein